MAVTLTAVTIIEKSDPFLPVSYANDALPPPSYPWSHILPWQAYDHPSIRRGFQVYQQICASCHSLNLLAYYHMKNVAYTEDELKAMTAELDIEDGPNDIGEMFTRPGTITDHIVKPYPNEQAARASNAGALPTDLSLMVKANHHGENYIFSLLTGYKEPPPGIVVKNGLYYNPYFAGSQIAMPQQLHEGSVEYDDGTEATISQMAKDVTTFLAWAAEPHQDQHKLMGIKALFITSLVAAQLLYWKRLKFTLIKQRITAIKR